jgi:hypothetical protein
MRISVLIGCFISLWCNISAQYITHGPVFGAVTSTGCKVYVRTKQCGKVRMELSTKENLDDAVSFCRQHRFAAR